MKNTFPLRTYMWSIVIAVSLFVAILAVFVIISHAKAASSQEDGRIITIHDKGEERGIISNAKTVRDVLKQAKIAVQPNDNVDPSLETELSAKAYQINIYRAQPVLIADGNSRITAMTPYETPKQIAKSAKLPLYDEDITKLVRSDNVIDTEGSGLKLTITRATKFNLVLYGKLIESRTQEKTVAAMLKDKKIELGPNDAVSVPIDTAITADMKVEVWRNGKQTITEEHPVAFPIQQIKDADKPVGFKEVKTAGVLGKKNVTFEIDMRNGQEVSRQLINELVTTQPQQQVEVVGTKPSFSGDFAAALAKLRSCEGGYNSLNPAGPYYGAYQFDASTWASSAPAGAEFGNATPEQQDQAAYNLYQRRGWQPWPHCGASLPDTYR